jgi:carboxymethylenebutenolidase
MILHHVLLLLLGLCLVGATFVAPGLVASIPAITARAVEYPGSEGEMPAKLYTPAEPGRRPGVLVLHTVAGPGPNVEAFAADLAAAGYVTMTPDVFSLHDFGPDGRVDHPLVLKDAEGALNFLAAQPGVDPTRLGVVGFSFGGRLAVILASLAPARLRAVVAYYAVTSHPALGRPLAGRAATAQPLPQRVPAIRAPILIHHGDADRNVPVAQARLLHEALVAAGKASTLHTYPGADHLFNFSLGPDVNHHPDAARLSWERTLTFLNRHLKTAR